MRALSTGDMNTKHFAATLLLIGNGSIPHTGEDSVIDVPKKLGTQVQTEDELIHEVYHNINVHTFTNPDWLKERAILAARNDTVDRINAKLLDSFGGNQMVFKSFDTTLEQSDAVQYTTEFLNELNPSGLPPHRLVLKVGCPIMLLRNLNPPRLCNGTRLIVKSLMKNLIVASIITGEYAGEVVFIPRISLAPSDYPFEFRRKQYPVKLSYCMTINKAQGQSLKVCGLHLEQNCFAHGQFYVACSRTGGPDRLKILCQEGQSKNIVYKQALQN